MILHHAPPPPAIRARRHHPKHPPKPLLRNPTLPATLHANHRARPRLRPAPLALLTLILPLKLDRLLRPRRHVRQRQFHLRLEIKPALHPPPPPLLPPATAAEDVVE